MNFDDYQNGGNAVYRRLAELVRDIIQEAADRRTDLRKVQAYQAREKSVSSLKSKLENRGLLDDPDVGDKIKDLAGVRVILYTNVDVNRYLQSRLIIEALNVHWEETKAHYPSDENDGVEYEGFHYVVSLPNDVAVRPEYADLKDLRCEVQIQTLLAHAFAESSHDIIYKGDDTPGFGGRLRREMQQRLNKAVNELLRPAGYELDKVQADFENLRRGIELFDRREIEALAHCVDNNERYDRLNAIADCLLPHYDDIGSVIGEVHRALLAVVADARNAAKVPHRIEGVEIEGRDASDVLRIVLRILTDFRYVDVEATFRSLMTLYHQETEADVRRQIIETAEKLTSYNLHVWKKVGPSVQLYLSDALAKLTDAEIDAIRPLAIVFWRCLLKSEIDGTSWTPDTVTISRSAVPACADIEAVRAMAIKGLTGLLDRSMSDDERRPVILAFLEASQLPYQANYSNALLAVAIRDLSAIADTLLPRLAVMNYDLWEHIESHLYREYRRFRYFAEAQEDDKGCKADAEKLVAAIKAVRDRMNRRRNYVRYKTLVGYEGVFSQQWDQEEIDYVTKDKFRKERAARFVRDINECNADRWLQFIKMCAATKSNDMATFPIFSEFLEQLGEQKPAVAIKAIETKDADILNFLPTLLSGLSKGPAKTACEKITTGFIGQGKYLAEIAYHLRFKPGAAANEVVAVLEAAMKLKDCIAVIECLVSSVAMWPRLGDDVIPSIFLPAIEWLAGRKDTRWGRGVWFVQHLGDFCNRLDAGQSQLVLDNLRHLERVDYEYERILTCIGVAHPHLIWAFFRDRLVHGEGTGETNYQPIPYELHDLRRVLAADPLTGLREVRKWFKSGDNMFQFTGGRLLHAAFPICTTELASAALEVCKDWSDEDIDFVLDVFQNYRGEESIHEIAKALVSILPQDDRRLGIVSILLENTGVVRGELGMVDAMRERKNLMVSWLEDENPKVRAFAERAIRHLDNRIATEKRDADMSKERRKRDYE